MTLFGFRPALWPTAFTLPALLVLLALGTWQMQRLWWKTNLIQSMEDRVAAPAVDLPAGAIDVAEWEYRRVRVSGRFLHEREFHLLAVSPNGQHGYQIVTPLRRAGAGDAVLVNRGWVPSERKDPATRPLGQIAGEVTLAGIARKPWDQGLFVPDNDPARNLWFYGDAGAMRRAAALTGPDLFIEAEAGVVPGGLPVGGQTRLNIPNRHLQYALMWYGFAVALAAIYVLWHRRERPEVAP